MPGALAANGGQSEKQPVKFTPIYTGRIFTGIWTNRSPLRDAASTRTEEKYYGPRGDAMIAGSNVEVSNRLTLIRRPGNPIYDNINTYNSVLSFDEFRISKGLSDVWGTTVEQIDTMVDTVADLYADTSSFSSQAVFVKSAGAGQSYMKQVGNQLYFGNGIDNKKWSQSLFVRNSGNNSTAINTDSYPFMDTFLIDSNGNIQQMIGTKISTVSNASIVSNVLTLTVSDLGANQPLGTQFMLWGFTNSNTLFLNGATITLSVAYTSGGTTLTANFIHPNVTQADTGYVQIESGGSPVTGVSVPTWGTAVPSSSNDFQGSITIDGNVIWVNRGLPTQNWGLAAPTQTPTFTASGSSVGWAKDTYYSPASIFSSTTGSPNTAGYLWQITKAGVTGSTQPAWPASPTPSTKIDITNVSISANVVTFTTSTQSLSAGDVVVMSLLDVATFLNGASLTVLSAGLTSTQFEANFSHPNYTSAADLGIATKAGTTQADGAAIWTCIQSPASLTWAAHTHYHEGDFLLAPVGSAQQYFFLRKNSQPFINGAITSYGWNSTTNGAFNKAFPAPAADFTQTPPSLNWAGATGQNTQFKSINGAGEVGANNDSGHYENWEAAIVCQLYIPAPGIYTFTLAHDDGAFFSFDTSTGAYLTLGSLTDSFGHAKTAKQGYGSASSLVGNNNSGANTDSATWVFPTAGNYGLEIDWTNWQHASQMVLTCNGQQIAITPDESGTTQPAWPAFTTTGASYDNVNDIIIFGASVQEAAKQYTWSNIGPIGDFTWVANTDFTLPGTQIVDSNSNEEAAYETGVSGTAAPVWATTLSSITADNPNLQWINEGAVPSQASATGKITATSAQGWLYALALVDTLDNTVSNIGPLSAGTGPVIGGQVTFAPGSGLPTDLTQIDSQADYVAIFRTTDGLTTELLIPSNGNTNYTVPLTQYLRYGYVDTTPDTGLDTLVQAAAAGENTPPLPGAINLTYHLNRLWYSIGSTVYYTTGPLAPVGNGINGTAPLNYDKMPSLVKRLVPTSIGVLVFTVSDVYIIQTSGGNIYPGIPYAPGIGISSYNALDTNGPEIGFFTTDHQFLIFNPNAGLDQASIALADQYRKSNSLPGSNWNPVNVFVSHYASGDDMGWFVADGSQGWYKLISTPAPDGPGHCWSPFATIAGGVKAIKSVETSPGVHALLLGPTGSGKIRERNVDATSDGGTTNTNGTAYAAYAVFGSYVLVQPGQIAQIAFITTDSVKVGSPLIVGVLIDEALPYYTGSFEMIKVWVTDPPGLPESNSILGQRFYLNETQEPAACRHMQLMVQWPAEAAQNELQSFTLFGCYSQET